MPRANRVFVSGHAWHLTHRCHRREFLLKFARDRRRWRYWLQQARQRFGLCVLNYIVTSNHIHLLVLDRGQDEIPRSMQLIAGRTAQEYNQRKARRGAYWEDRYHATAIDTDGYLARCMVYIDMNMVRAGAVTHPGAWDTCGFREIQYPPQRNRIIDTTALMRLLDISDFTALQRIHAEWIAEALMAEPYRRDQSWSESLAVGSRDFVTRFQSEQGAGSLRRTISEIHDLHRLHETAGRYEANSASQTDRLTAKNVVFLDQMV